MDIVWWKCVYINNRYSKTKTLSIIIKLTAAEFYRFFISILYHISIYIYTIILRRAIEEINIYLNYYVNITKIEVTVFMKKKKKKL